MDLILNSDGSVPLKLYYKLEEGRVANAEVISRASLAFIAGVKELAFVLDPSVSVQIGIKGYAEGSLWEDLLLIAGKLKSEVEERPTRYLLALSALGWITAPPMERIRDNWWQPHLEKYLPEATAKDKSMIERAVSIAESGKIAVREKQQFYREIGRDTAIEGVGANIDRSQPTFIVPRSAFPAYSGQTPTLVTELDRSTIGPMRVVILSPVLEVSNRRWKFATAQGEFGAAVKDKAFLERIVAGQTAVRMRGGVELDVELETKERLVNGVWTIVERNILRVVNIIEPRASRQGSLFSKDRH